MVAGKEQPPSHDATEWSLSMPSYMQSTVQTDICDAWSDAINEAEAEAEARDRARQEGRDPDDAAQLMRAAVREQRTLRVWSEIRKEAARDIDQEPMLSSFLYASILTHKTFHEALSFVLSNRLADQTMLPTQLFSLFESLFISDPEIIRGAIADLQAVYDRDPACISYSCALLYFKGYQAIQIHRLAHALWKQGRRVMALSLQSRMSEVLSLDIHPAATFGKGILLDHGTGVVIGETTVIGNGVSIMQNVTLGGTGKEVGDRHPKIRNNVLIGAGAAILGNIVVGTGAQVVAGSLVLKPVEAHTMVAGSPAKCVGQVKGNPALQMEQWSKVVEESRGPDASTNGRRPVLNTPGHSSAEDAIFGTGLGADPPAADAAAPNAASAAASADARPAAPLTHPDAAGAASNGNGAGPSHLGVIVSNGSHPHAPDDHRAASASRYRGVLDSISEAESSGRHARIEKKRDWIKSTTAGRSTPPPSVPSGRPRETSEDNPRTPAPPPARPAEAGSTALAQPAQASKAPPAPPGPPPKAAPSHKPPPPPAKPAKPVQPAEEVFVYDI